MRVGRTTPNLRSVIFRVGGFVSHKAFDDDLIVTNLEIECTIKCKVHFTAFTGINLVNDAAIKVFQFSDLLPTTAAFAIQQCFKAEGTVTVAIQNGVARISKLELPPQHRGGFDISRINKIGRFIMRIFLAELIFFEVGSYLGTIVKLVCAANVAEILPRYVYRAGKRQIVIQFTVFAVGILECSGVDIYDRRGLFRGGDLVPNRNGIVRCCLLGNLVGQGVINTVHRLFQRTRIAIGIVVFAQFLCFFTRNGIVDQTAVGSNGIGADRGGIFRGITQILQNIIHIIV